MQTEAIQAGAQSTSLLTVSPFHFIISEPH